MPLSVEFEIPKLPRFKVWTDEAPLNLSFRYIQEKLDGNLTYLAKHPFGHCAAFSKKPTDITKYVRDRKFYKTWHANAPRDSLILGEIYVPNRPAAAVKTSLANFDGKSRFRPFAIWKWAGELTPAAMELEKVNTLLRIIGLSPIPFSIWDGKIPNQEHEHHEGWVFKNGNLADWCKYKFTRTIDLIVTGFSPGEGKYVGTLGSLQLNTTERVCVCNCSGMTDEQRDYFWANRYNLIGKIVEVRYDRIDARGRLRFPRFLKMRDDKQKEDCRLDQDPKLLSYWKEKGY